MEKEIIINTLTAEEAEANAEQQIETLMKRLLVTEDFKEKIEICNMITEIKQQLKDYLLQQNN